MKKVKMKDKNGIEIHVGDTLTFEKRVDSGIYDSKAGTSFTRFEKVIVTVKSLDHQLGSGIGILPNKKEICIPPYSSLKIG